MNQNAGTGAGMPGPLSVSDLTTRVKGALEASIPFCWVLGEVSDMARPGSGHCYLTLTDRHSQLSCVMFRLYAQQLRFTPEIGSQVLAYGNVSVYERGGRYQFYVYRLRPAGVGDMAVAFEQLRARLESEGLFDVERKRPLPRRPQRVGVVTSASGAAIRDIVHILARRAPGLQVILAPARVQGTGAGADIAAAIERLSRFGNIDILIVGRGGGSPEDLWAFNDEVVARAIFASPVPVVSAVGHETDHTIADDVADLRAPTPSAAAELVAEESQVLRRQVLDLHRRLRRGIDSHLERRERDLDYLDPRRRLGRLRERIEQQDQRLDECCTALLRSADSALMRQHQRFVHAAVRLHTLDPLARLGRGFAFCEHDGKPVRAAADLRPGDRVQLRFADGGVTACVEEIDR